MLLNSKLQTMQAGGGGPSAAPVHESFTGQAISGATSGAITKPSGTVQGDFLLFMIISDGIPTITPPSDTVPWNELTQISHTSNQVRIGIFYKFAGASEPASYTFTLSATESAYMGMARVSGVNTSTPIGIETQGWDSGESITASLVLPSITTQSDLTLLYHCTGTDKNLSTPTLTPPGGGEVVIFDVEEGGTAGVLAAMAYEAGPLVAGATGTRTWTTRASEDSIGILLALNPA